MLFVPIFSISQTDRVPVDLDFNYLEDQLYVGINYNFMLNKPAQVLQSNFSYSLQGGVIRDMPINNKRTVAIGLGVGYAANSYYSNLIGDNSNTTISYTIASTNTTYNRSKFETHSIEMPIEFRWRNATPLDYKFMRIYTGVKLEYNFSAKSKLVTDNEKIVFNNKDIEKLQYGLTLNVGYNTFNLHIYYALSDFIKNDTYTSFGEMLKIKPIKIGLIFYLL